MTSEHDDDEDDGFEESVAKLKMDCVDDSLSPQSPVVSTGRLSRVCDAVST